MKAIVINEYGGPECLEYADAPTPEPGPNEVLIKSKFIGVNFTDIRNRVGDGDGKVPMIIGVEASGEIVKLGPGCTKFKVGDFVTSFTRGHAYAEYVTGLEKFTEKISEEFAQKPESAGILVTVPLALNVVERAGRIRPGETVLLHAASGGVGSIIGQLVKKIEGTRLFGTISDSSKSGYAKKNGYDELMSYEEFADRAKELTNGKGVDAILDPVGGEVQKRSLEIVAPFGRLVSYSNISRAPMDLPSALWFRSKCIGFVGISNGSLSEHSPAILAETLRRSVQLVEDGTIRIDVTEVLPLAEASKAHAIFESRAATGKFILAV
jgi:NADPH2:quinone reductase